jgi:hypothetical protein
LESIQCPGCQKPIRLPEETLGQIAKCPFCKCHFKAPIRTPEGLTDPFLLRRNLFGRNRVVLPATLMLMLGMVGFFNNAVVAIKSQVDRDGFEADTRAFFEQLATKPEKEEDRDAIRARIPAAIQWGPAVRVAAAAFGLVSIVGSITMLRRLAYSFTLLASFVTMFNVMQCCCFTSILVGGYSLYVLMDPEVRRSFRGRSQPTGSAITGQAT